MKKMRILATLVVAIVLCACLVACFPKNYSKAEANLKDAGYTVVTVSNGNAVGEAALAAEEISIKASIKADIKLIATVTATKGTDEDIDSIHIYYCESSENAKALKTAYTDMITKTKDQYKEMLDEKVLTQAEYDEAIAEVNDTKLGVSGKAFYAGSAAAVKAAK